ncbi:uncharacterized protein LOC108344229 [Vigna angularis]|uniref:uncharacterized protein LOC108344229 n=1 Tax=Phaseolus angularis TaxID=3914 RepID=UPI00080A66C7|nr:uncharacterized protein LOC108344229 [Vigna angularis]
MDASSPKYFITFIDDYSRYMYLYLLCLKDEALDAFKLFKAEVELQCGKKIKIVRSDKGGEYYGRYTKNGQARGPFTRFLQEHGIVAQYTMLGSPDQNGVAKRRNQTLMDMRIRHPIIEVPKIFENGNIDQVVDEEQQVNVDQPIEQQASHQDVETSLRRSTRIKRPTVSSEYEVYLQESDYNIGAENDPETFSQAMSSKESNLWHNAMKDEMDSMTFNQV